MLKIIVDPFQLSVKVHQGFHDYPKIYLDRYSLIISLVFIFIQYEIDKF